jgi:hypothetical protein
VSDFASQVSEKDHNEVSDFVPFEVSDFAKSVSEKVLFSWERSVLVLYSPTKSAS